MEKNSMMKEILSWVFHISIAIVIGLLVVNFVIQRTIVDGESMEPTLQNGDNLWVEKLTPRFGKLKHGDIVVINVPEKVGKERSPLIKRVIALEGDTIELRDGTVYLNGKALKEDYINGDFTQSSNPEYSKITVPEGFVYAMGDNRGNSTDSRMIGPVEVNKISGKAVLRFLPLNKFGLIK